MNGMLKLALGSAGLALASNAAAQITIYEHDGFKGRSYASSKQVGNLERFGFNDRASSVIVAHDRWEVCEDVRFAGRCVVLRPGRYPSLAAMGLNDRVTSVRIVARNTQVDDHRYGPQPAADFRRRGNERLYKADVTSVRAVMGTPQQRCWTEREHVPNDRREANIPATLAGAVIGGILGHQVGSGRGNDIATVGGALAGGAIGYNVGGDAGQRSGYSQDVQRCSTTPADARPEYWDVRYNFRGQEHQVQMSAPPGRTLNVNQRGEPRA